MAKSFKRYDLFSCELGLQNDDHDDNYDKNVDIKIGSLKDFADLIFFWFWGNAFKKPNGIIDGRHKTCFWLRPAVGCFTNIGIVLCLLLCCFIIDCIAVLLYSIEL